MFRHPCITVLLAFVLLLPARQALSEPGVTHNQIVLGQTIGFNSVWGDVYRNYTKGFEAYLRQVNADGGVHGRKIEILRLEDRYETDIAVGNVRRFGEEKSVFGLVCIGGTAITSAVSPLLEQYRLPTVGALTGADSARKHNPYLFFTRAGYSDEVGKMIEHLATISVRRIAIVYQASAFGESNLHAAQAAAAGRNLQIVAALEHAITGWDANDVSKKLFEAKPQAVLMFSPPATVADVLNTYRAAFGSGVPRPWVLSVTPPQKLVEGLGEYVRGVAMTQVMPHPSLATSRLASAYRQMWARQRTEVNRSHEALEGYVTARVVVEALRRSGRDLTRAGYVRALESLGDFKVEDFRIPFSQTHHLGPSFVEVTMLSHKGQIIR